MACVSVTISEAANSYEVNANHGSWPADGFCRVIPSQVVDAANSYSLTVQLMNVIGHGGVNSGHPGVMYNFIDENNFDVLYFRLISLVFLKEEINNKLPTYHFPLEAFEGQ